MTPLFPGNSEPIPVSVLLMAASLLLPLALAVGVRRKLDVGWRYFGFGAIVGGALVIFWHIVGEVIAMALREPTGPGSLRPFLLNAGVTVAAGLIGAGLIYAGYRWLMHDEEKTWEKAVMYGLGLGVPAALWQVLGPFLAAKQFGLTLQVVLIGDPAWGTLLGLLRFGWGLAVLVALAVLVLQVFRDGRVRWPVLAVLGYALWSAAPNTLGSLLASSGSQVDLIQPGWQLGDTVREITKGILGLLALWVIVRLHDEPVQPTELPQQRGLPESGGQMESSAGA